MIISWRFELFVWGSIEGAPSITLFLVCQWIELIIVLHYSPFIVPLRPGFITMYIVLLISVVLLYQEQLFDNFQVPVLNPRGILSILYDNNCDLQYQPPSILRAQYLQDWNWFFWRRLTREDEHLEFRLMNKMITSNSPPVLGKRCSIKTQKTNTLYATSTIEL